MNFALGNDGNACWMSLAKNKPRIASPPIRWLMARNRSAEKLRSANWLLKNIPTNDASAKAFRIHDCCIGEKPRLGKYPKISGSHAPQMKNSRNIMTSSRPRTGRAGPAEIPMPSRLATPCAPGRSSC